MISRIHFHTGTCFPLSAIIGLTIVALGTSAPELAVSTAASIQGSNEIALSNVPVLTKYAIRIAATHKLLPLY